jgi:hypothetical protein
LYVAVNLGPSVYKDESPLAASPFAISADKMRVTNGRFETIYGQELVTADTLTGICRGMFTWADISRTGWCAFGTHLRLQVIDQDGTLEDITPVIERGELSSAFTTSSGSTLITVTDNAHGLVVNQLTTFLGTSSAANVTISGDYAVSTVFSASAYGIDVSTANQSTAGVGPSVIDYEYHLAPGNESGLGGLGYGTGGYGVGGYSSPASSVDLDPRTWSMTQWGQNLIANPAWGGIYEWAPNVSSTELVNTGDFSSTGNWTFGSGWTLGSGNASASAVAGDLSQSLSLERAAWHLLDFDMTRNAGTVVALIGTSTIQSYATSGTKKVTFFGNGTQTLRFRNSGAFNGTIDNVSVKVLTEAQLIANAPSSCGSVFVTAERNLVACGTINEDDSVLDPMHVRWSDRENNQSWAALPSNLAGGYTLSHGSRIIRGLPGNRENIIFTDTAVYRMRSVPDPSVVYAFDLLGEGCGLIGPNAVIQVNGSFFWIGTSGKFYAYSGGAPQPLANQIERDFWDNLADVQHAKIYAAHLSARSEVWWFYPDERDGIECSRYIVLNYKDGTWVTGDYTRSAYADAGIFPYPISADTSGAIYYQEKDFSNDGGARSSSLESSYFQVGDGETVMRIMGVRPDFDDLRGGMTITFYSKFHPQGDERTYGPFSITSSTQQISVRMKGRQIKWKIEANDAPSFYRLGKMTFDVRPSGEKR